jgi:DNA-binding NtrC family response regulator
MLSTATVLVVDDEPRFHETLDRALRETSYRRLAAYNVFQARDILRHEPVDVVLLDLGLPGARGDELLAELGDAILGGRTEVVMVTSDRSTTTAVRCAHAGAFDFVEKTAELYEQMPLVIHRALEHRRQRRTALAARAAKAAQEHIVPLVRSASPEVKSLVRRLHTVAGTIAPALIEAADGLGVEHLAHYLHLQSPREGNPFVVIDLSRLGPSEADAQLLTAPIDGAVSDIELADGGTLYLAAVDRLSVQGQGALVRLLASGESPSSRGHRLDVRVVASTARPDALSLELSSLFGVQHLRVPTLRERSEDVPMLLEWSAERRLPPGLRPRFTGEALWALRAYSWPGQLRELEELVTQLGAARGGGVVELTDLPFPIAVEYLGQRASGEAGAGRSLYRAAVSQFHRLLFGQVLKQHGGNRRAAARALGIPYPTFKRKVRQLGMGGPGGEDA